MITTVSISLEGLIMTDAGRPTGSEWYKSLHFGTKFLKVG